MSEPEDTQRESMEFDVLIVGGGPSGLAATIRLKQLSPDTSVCLIEKGSEIGAHIKKLALRLPTPPGMHNHGNYVVSLGNVCRWLGAKAEALGVDITRASLRRRRLSKTIR